MPSTKKAQKAAAARAQAAKFQKKMAEVADQVTEPTELDVEHAREHDSDLECTSWTGTANYVPSDTDDEDWNDTDLNGGGVKLESNEDSDDEHDLEDLEGEDLLDGLRNHWELLQ
jgi:hypothetical protein